MKRAALYSSAQSRRPQAGADESSQPADDAAEAGATAKRPGWRARSAAQLGAFGKRWRTPLLAAGILLLACVPVLVYWSLQTPPTELTQDDIDDAVQHTWEHRSLPSRSAKAAEAIRQSVVRVRGMLDDDDTPAGKDKDKSASKGVDKDPKNGKAKAPTQKEKERARDNAHAEAAPKAPPQTAAPDARKDKSQDKNKPGDRKTAKAPPGLHEHGMSIGSGVVILDKGVILTNMHVVAGAKRLFVTFYDGMESEADLVGAFPENDLAVLQARRIPDDLPAATLGSSKRLKPGDEVVAVGFPFDIGPSVSAGVVSGLNREFRAPAGEKSLKNLIQFDAAANSGNSGGPLVTMDGEVVGIVTAILNPNGAGTFVGIGFAVTIEGAGSAVGIPPF